MQKINDTICVIGIWHLGSVTAACMAHLGHKVIGVDPDKNLIRQLNNGQPPLFEPGLEEMISDQLLSGRLSFDSDIGSSVRESSCVMLAFDTPVDESDATDLSPILKAAENIAPHLNDDSVVIVQSQVPVGTCHRLTELIGKMNPHIQPRIAYMPENLRLGQAIDRFLNPSFLVIGTDNEDTLTNISKAIAPITGPRVLMDLKTAEMTKHALNAFFATSISFANELGNLCDLIGADAFKIAQAMRLDERIGPKAMISPGSPFGGGTLARDLRTLQDIGHTFDYRTTMVDGAIQVNEYQKDIAIHRLLQVFGTLKGLNIGVLGLTYKPGTSTLRRSQSLEMIEALLSGGALVKAFDPGADLSELVTNHGFTVEQSAHNTAIESDAIILATDWPEFLDIDFESIHRVMRRPVLVDTKNFLDLERLTNLGFIYLPVGRGIQPLKEVT